MIRPSGTYGPPRVRVRQLNTPLARMLDGLSDRSYSGRWVWQIPAPKGHPRTPKWHTLYGHAKTLGEAADAGRARLAEVYGPAKPL
jgi:hypothetical protein